MFRSGKCFVLKFEGGEKIWRYVDKNIKSGRSTGYYLFDLDKDMAAKRYIRHLKKDEKDLKEYIDKHAIIIGSEENKIEQLKKVQASNRIII